LTAFSRGKLRSFGLDQALTTETSDDVRLVDRCRNGESAAWEEIVSQFSRRVFNLAYRFTSDVEAAEDLTQDVFVKIFRSLDQFDSKQGDLSRWLMRIARNLIIDDYRKRQRNPQNSKAEDVEDHDFRLRSHEESAQSGMEREERAKLVHQAIGFLSPDLKECVVLRDIDEMTYQEIAEQLRIPEGTVKSRINRGRIELAKRLREMNVIRV
jgi:RNA polymerase sigma-70 factor (ECF subfamily)